MNKQVKLLKANFEDLQMIWKMQVEAFSELYEKYHDTETSPATEEIDKIIWRFNQPETTYYFIMADGEKVGVIRVIDCKDDKTRKRISPIFIMPGHRGMGYAQQAIREAERLHGKKHWQAGARELLSVRKTRLSSDRQNGGHQRQNDHCVL